jgi:hypothetical protein
MKIFISKIITLILILLLLNYILGIIRLKIGDPITYTSNRNSELITLNQQKFLINLQMKILPINEMSNEPAYGKDSVKKTFDQFGFSNVIQNRSPYLLYIGDSFFDDPLLNSVDGILSLTNK